MCLLEIHAKSDCLAGQDSIKPNDLITQDRVACTCIVSLEFLLDTFISEWTLEVFVRFSFLYMHSSHVSG